MVMSVGLLITTPEHAVFIVLTNIHHRAAEDRILHGWHCNKEMIGQIQRAGGGAQWLQGSPASCIKPGR
jgi:hypothetical protein